MISMPRLTGVSTTGGGAIVAAAFVALLDVFLMFYIPVENCMAKPSGTSRGRFVEQYLCSHTLLDDGILGVVRFVSLWGPLVILFSAWIIARRRKGSAA